MIAAAPASAQFKPRPLNDPATGERYHVEAAVGIWSPTADMSISSEGSGVLSGIPGTTIDFKRDLGLTDQKFRELHLVLRPSKAAKFRFQYIPIKYQQGPVIINRAITFNGQTYNVGLPVNSSLDWKAYRIGYEYDFVVKNRGYGGFVVDFKYTDVQATVATPAFAPEFAHARAPIPAVGGIFRVYVVPNISITGEVSGFKMPKNIIKDATGHYIDVDFYGTVNLTNYFGAQVGYRSFDVGYLVTGDTGAFKLKGMYFGGVARF
jgi:hypothetical protein